MRWAIVQLTAWADKTLLTRDLAQELRRRVATPDLELFYPVVEDVAGKHAGGYSEYVFVEWREDVAYELLENTEMFRGVLRGPRGKIELLEDDAIAAIREKCLEDSVLRAGERVLVWKGPMRGNVAEVVSADGAQVHLRVALGDDLTEAVLPANWVRRRRKRRVGG